MQNYLEQYAANGTNMSVEMLKSLADKQRNALKLYRHKSGYDRAQRILENGVEDK